jgi:hypothetical protein
LHFQAAAAWSVWLADNECDVMSSAVERFERRHGELRRAAED